MPELKQHHKLAWIGSCVWGSGKDIGLEHCSHQPSQLTSSVVVEKIE